ncbi:hypothetical protein KCP73_02220 [Salmonella enterica subsp. enterica]|nr:hypothetical protein KCP73_02220 [Salmonella enterica subsp. enterica]
MNVEHRARVETYDGQAFANIANCDPLAAIRCWGCHHQPYDEGRKGKPLRRKTRFDRGFYCAEGSGTDGGEYFAERSGAEDTHIVVKSRLLCICAMRSTRGVVLRLAGMPKSGMKSVMN